MAKGVSVIVCWRYKDTDFPRITETFSLITMPIRYRKVQNKISGSKNILYGATVKELTVTDSDTAGGASGN